MKMRFLPDEPITGLDQDLLGFGDFAKLIQASVYETRAPFVYGVLGDWGSGKTSILHLLECRLNADLETGTSQFVPIWFNAWQYENDANLIYPLLHAIRRDYDCRVGAFNELQGFGSRFIQVVVTSTLALTDIGLRLGTKYLTGEAIKLDDLAGHLKMDRQHPGRLQDLLGEWADQVERLGEAFAGLLNDYACELAARRNTEKDKIRFVILIDDLDRCLPDTAIGILESIKNHLTAPNCIFVLALNPKVIYQGIRTKYQGLEFDGREYLEKILNYSFYVPEPVLGGTAQFATSRLAGLLVDDSDREHYKQLLEEFGNILDECRFNNPRKIKRILNRYLLFIGKYAGKDFDNQYLVRLIIMAEYYSDLFQLLLRERYYDGDEELLQELASIHSEQFDVKSFEEKFGVSIAFHYLHLSQKKGLFDFTNLGSKAFGLARDVFTITRVC